MEQKVHLANMCRGFSSFRVPLSLLHSNLDKKISSFAAQYGLIRGFRRLLSRCGIAIRDWRLGFAVRGTLKSKFQQTTKPLKDSFLPLRV